MLIYHLPVTSQALSTENVVGLSPILKSRFVMMVVVYSFHSGLALTLTKQVEQSNVNDTVEDRSMGYLCCLLDSEYLFGYYEFTKR